MKLIHKYIAASVAAFLLSSATVELHAAVVDRDSICEGQVMVYRWHLTRNCNVSFLAYGDDNVRDLDIKVYDPYGNLIEQDMMEDAEPYVEFVTRVSGEYRIEVIMHDTRNGVYADYVLHRSVEEL